MSAKKQPSLSAHTTLAASPPILPAAAALLQALAPAPPEWLALASLPARLLAPTSSGQWFELSMGGGCNSSQAPMSLWCTREGTPNDAASTIVIPYASYWAV